MNKKIVLILFFLLSISNFAQTIKSPDGKLILSFNLTPKGEPVYSLFFLEKSVIETSRLGIKLEEGHGFVDGFSIVKIDSSSVNEIWEPVWGEVKKIRNNCKELTLTLSQESVKNRILIIRFRLFDDGLGFRYEFPEQTALQYLKITDELTEFNLTGDHKAFWMPGDFDTNEYDYSITPLTQVDALRGKLSNEIAVKSIIAENAVQTPLMMKSNDGLYINIHEAALVNYPAMNLLIDKNTFTLKAELVPDIFGIKAYLQAPCRTPWRTIIVSDKAEDILSSKIILNLNEPAKIDDVSWIKPMKYVGIWWEMHIGTSTWNYADTKNVKIGITDWSKLIQNGRHGATTENTKKYIDFAAEHGFGGVLIEGWNIGWEDWFGNWKENVFDFITCYPDFNLAELKEYAAEKGIKLIMHHETSGSATNYERRIDEAYRFMNKHGYNAVKTGYVGKIIPRGEHHDGQWMVNHYMHVAEKTAEYKIMLDAHEPVRPTGLHRTYPNWLSCEAGRGNEYNAWSKGNKPEHETILPFTRLIGGPMDYTPGIFQIKLDHYSPGKKEQVHTTLAKQLALYVTIYSPLQMAADLPENYERFPDALKFIEDVAVDWDDTKIIEAEPGDYITIARKTKGREEWFIGAITDEVSRTAIIPLHYLNPEKKYTATIYSDAPDASWDVNPMAYLISNHIVTSKDNLKIKLVEGGGAAVSIKESSEEDLKKFTEYQD
ncbi:MAG: glycoside hydrolase family 97 protein [Ignavibacteria bacterium]